MFIALTFINTIIKSWIGHQRPSKGDGFTNGKPSV